MTKIHKRGRYSAALKEKVSLEALKREKTLQQIASENNISPELVRQWKKQALEGVTQIFKRTKSREKALEEQNEHSRVCYVNEKWNWSGSQKIQGAGSLALRRQLLDEENSELPRKRQCELLSLHRSGTYYKPRAKADETPIEKALNELYIKDPCLGLRKLPDMVERHYGIKIGAKKIARIRKGMRIKTIYRHPKTSAPAKRKEGPRSNLLNSLLTIDVDKVWCSDITYLQIGSKNYYLCVVLDWASREVLGWSLSDNMSTRMCLDALHMALAIGRKPEIFNTNQGSQYTSHEWFRELEERGISISMDGKGRWTDNIAVERFWHTYKHDSFLLNEVNTLEEARRLTAHWLTSITTESALMHD